MSVICFVFQDNVLVLLCDGYESYLTSPFIQLAKSKHIMVLLRPPNPTEVLQVKDESSVGLFKQRFISAKLSLFRDRIVAHEEHASSTTASSLVAELCWSDVLPLVHGPWTYAFTHDNIVKNWDRMGICPFTRCVEHKLREHEDQALLQQTEVQKPHPNEKPESELLCKACEHWARLQGSLARQRQFAMVHNVT